MSDTDEIEIPPPKKARRSRTTRNSLEPANDFSEDLSSRRRSSRRVTKTILQESTTMSTDDDASQTAPEQAQESNLEQVDENIEINNPEKQKTLQKSNPDLPLSSEERSKFIKDISTDPDIQAELGKTNKKSSEMLAITNGVALPDYEYTPEDFSSLKDYKSYYAKFKKILSDHNAGIGMIKINAIVAAIFREFKLANPVDGSTSLDTSKERVEEKNSEKEKSEEVEKPKATSRKAAPKKKSASPSKDPKFKLQKVPPIKIRIPNARTSTKKGKKGVESDHEFEESLLEMERQQDAEDQKKSNAKKSRAEERRLKQEREEERAEAERKRREENPEIYEEEQKREALEAELREQDDGKRQNFDEHYEYCMVCKDGGDLLLCDTCPCSYHMKCLNPPMVECPDGDWSCPRCSSLSFPEKIEKILAWRWKEATHVEIDDVRPGKEGQKRKLWGIRSREYYVKYKNMSYWRCEWIAELRLEVHEVHLWRYYNNKQDMDNPTWTEDLDNFEDPELGERFFKYGVKEAYMEVHRIINHNETKNGELEYFVKWKQMPYSKCTWETEEDGIPDYEKNEDSEDDDSDQDLDEEEQKIYDQKKEAKLKKKTAEWKTVMQAADIRPMVEAYWKHRNSLEKSVKKPVRSAKKGKKRKKGRGGFQRKKEEIEDADSPAEFGSPRIPTEEPYEDQPGFIKDLPGNFKLHDYQIDGINWVRFSYGQGTDVILADEMGLGKTIQTVTFLKSLVYDNHTNGPFLVTVPLSTLPNWEREFDTWAPDLYVVSYYGDRDARQVIREHELSFDNDVMRSTKLGGKIRSGIKVKFHVLLTSYEMVALDCTTLSSISWASLTIDEAHRLKNANSKFFKVMKEYKVGHKLLLTGTPLQNTLEELFYLLNFLVPTKFDNMEVFLSSFCDLSKEDQIGRLHDMLGVHMLRRLKADVLKGFASKAEFLVRTEMSKEQKHYYKAVLTKNFDALRTKAGPASTSLINIMMDLRKVCNHPYLFQKAADDAPKLPNGYYEGAALVKSCGKLTILGQMLTKLKEQGHRVLIFSQMTRLLDLLEDAMDYWQYRYERIDGSVTGSVRQEAIDRFNAPNAEQFVFLLSTKAGGLGINLATADTVVIYDSDWNPHNDIQAFSRAHRIGQKNQVMIYRFVTRNSVEERIQQTAKKKMMLTHLVVRPGMGSNKLTGMSKNEMDDIMKFGTEELFKDEDKEKNIEYDEATINKLLDRSQVGIKTLDEEENGLLNDYLSSFKVATYKTKDEEEVEVDREVIAQEETTENTATFWENLLRCHYEEEVEVEQAAMGKGKRIRKQVQYLNLGVEDSKDDADADIGDNGSDSEDETEKDLKPKKLKRIQEKPLPPLLSRVNGNLEVYGFSIRARRAFMNMIMRWGLPPDNMKYEDRPYVRELRAKSDKEFNAYLALFTRHLCEPEIGNSPTYADGIPKEGMQRQMVLFRIGIMSLIKKKVEEFEAINGDWSEASRKPKAIEEIEEKIVEIIEKPEISANSKNPENSQNPENKASEATENDKPEESNKTKPSDTPKPDNLNTSDQKMTDDDPISDGGDSEFNDVTNDPDMKYDHRLNPNKKLKKRFMFNIADSGFTELHTLWNTEEVAAVKSGRLKEIWHRMHDYWLLAGIAKHGYSRWADIQQDMQYSLVQQPFLAMEKKRDNLLDMQKGFLQRRFKLLETALIIEEQLRRAELERCQVSQAHEALALAKHFNELDSLAEAHSSLTKDTHNQMGNVVLNRCLTRLDELLTDMKQDLARLPIAISQLQTVQERLGMNERYIVAHLLTASANLDEGKDDETAEVAQQREQFKEIAKNKSVATALRFCDNVGPFSVGKAVNFGVKLKENDDVIEIKDDDSQDEGKLENTEKGDYSTKNDDVETVDEKVDEKVVQKEEKSEENEVEEIKEELDDEIKKSDIKEELEADKTPDAIESTINQLENIIETMKTDETDDKEKTPDKNDDEMK